MMSDRKRVMMWLVAAVRGPFQSVQSGARLPIPAGILWIPVFSVPVAFFSQESQFLFRRNLVRNIIRKPVCMGPTQEAMQEMNLVDKKQITLCRHFLYSILRYTADSYKAVQKQSFILLPFLEAKVGMKSIKSITCFCQCYYSGQCSAPHKLKHLCIKRRLANQLGGCYMAPI